MVIDLNKARISRGLPVIGESEVKGDELVLELPRIPRFEVPEEAKAFIVAQYSVPDEEGSDPQSDYYRYEVTKTIFLGYSKHERRIFSELRKMCLKHPETIKLAGDEGVEHREMYTFGGGMFLTDKDYVNCGWKVKKHSFQGTRDRVDEVKLLLKGEVDFA